MLRLLVREGSHLLNDQQDGVINVCVSVCEGVMWGSGLHACMQTCTYAPIDMLTV